MGKKRIVYDEIDRYSGYELDGTVLELIAQLQGWVATHGPDIRIDYEQCQYYDDSYEFVLAKPRPENDVERAKRLEKAKAEKAQRDEWDRKQYEELKKKFGE